ncbi:MAG TPA: sialate O-acetylesterase [Chitinophagaceae bacterium]|nr:sialate O-acetylesterase [Chitinophagaceae bacterium]
MKRFTILVFLLPVFSSAQLGLAKIFSDNMVLQRNEPIHIWGKALPDKEIEVTFAHQIKTSIAAKDSTWNVYLKKQKENTHPQSMVIKSGNDRIELKNILIGDIWICSGQSNMEWPMEREMHLKQEIPHTDQPLIRLNNPPPAGRYVYGVAYTDSLNRRLNTNEFYQWNNWQVCDSNTIKDMSSVAYYFAKAIVSKENIPVGLINLSIGGAPIETFISKEALQKNKQFATKVSGNWLQNKSLPEWIRERGNENVGKNKNGYEDDLGLNHAYKPGFAFESGIKPLLSLPVKGVIWYQGESNSLEKERVEEYKDLLHLLIDNYREGWKQPDLPFYWVQLSSIDTTNYGSRFWPQFRDEQRKLLNEVKYGGMAVCSDIGFKDNVHPTNKKDVGERLARWALNKTYKESIVPSGPLPIHAKYKNGKVFIHFKYSDGLRTSDSKRLRGFTLDGRTDTEAGIKNDTVIINTIEKPAFIYYGWKPFTNANLVNSEGLPASTFKIKVK